MVGCRCVVGRRLCALCCSFVVAVVCSCVLLWSVFDDAVVCCWLMLLVVYMFCSWLFVLLIAWACSWCVAVVCCCDCLWYVYCGCLCLACCALLVGCGLMFACVRRCVFSCRVLWCRCVLSLLVCWYCWC